MKKCKYCKSNIDRYAKICPYCKKSQASFLIKMILIILTIFLVPIAFLEFMAAYNSVIDYEKSNQNAKFYDEDINKCYITLSEFNEIENGMTYDEIKSIVGCDGTVNSDTEFIDSTMTIYSWYGKDGISNAIVNISNGKMINKTQIGLK